MEALIPTKIGVPMVRTKIPKKANSEAIGKDLDMAYELHEAAFVHMALYQQRITNLYNRCVRQRAFQARDLVLRRVFENTVDPIAGKFQPYWEGPYTIVKVGIARLYALGKLDETLVLKMWNAMHLKRYYK